MSLSCGYIWNKKFIYMFWKPSAFWWSAEMVYPNYRATWTEMMSEGCIYVQLVQRSTKPVSRGITILHALNIGIDLYIYMSIRWMHEGDVICLKHEQQCFIISFIRYKVTVIYWFPLCFPPELLMNFWNIFSVQPV